MISYPDPFNRPPYQGPCPHCGHCPHCGRGYQYPPSYPNTGTDYPIWTNTTDSTGNVSA
jgi:hypothetical protein